MLKGALTKKVPIYVQFAVSNKCNLRCLMCNALDSRKSEKELGLLEIEKLADILKRLEVAILILSGGEPLIRTDLPEIIRLFADRGIEVRLQTNAVLANEEIVKNLIQAGLREVTISLDSLDSQKYDAITGVAGSWQKVIKGMALFSQYLPKKANMSGINVVVSKRNIEELPQIIEFVTRIGFYASLIPVHISDNTSREFIVRKNSPDFQFHPDDFPLIDRVYEKIIAMKKNNFNIYNSYRFLSESKEFLKNNKATWRCASPFLYFSISPSGNFLPCVDIMTNISMLDGDFFRKFHTQDFMESIRKKVEKCRGCMYACYPEISFFCHDFSVFIEMLIQGFKMQNSTRSSFSYEELIKIIGEIRQEDCSLRDERALSYA